MKTNALFIFVLLLLIQISATGQENEKWKNNLYGFIRADAFYDTRQSIEAVDGMFLLYPANTFYDSAGKDINDISKLTMTSVSSRLGLNITGKEFLNTKAQLNAKIEADFTARSNSNSLRLRHAYINVIFEKHSILMGRTWHPMFTPTNFPLTLSINVGTPFNPFNRSPQLRYTFTPNNNFTFIGAALYQNDYKNLGPSSDGTVDKQLDLMRNSKMPNLHIQGIWKTDITSIGLFGDYKKLQPRTYTTGTLGIFKTETTIESYSAGIFMRITKNKLKIKAKSLYGQNLTDHLLTGGYAVKSKNIQTGHETYTASNHLFNWINLEYGKVLMAGVLVGYSKNLGFTNNPLKSESIYARGADIDYLYRVSPYIKWSKSRIELWAETEFTTAAYGEIDYTNKGKVNNSKELTNIRVQFSCVYLIF
ncbi:MAG: hypothetical protein C0599_12945 [Salinivirgaceae bacterium]|nr:MAG: hypothetical protein C0599_12945 [Salinivirgaceae bacterium]